MAEIFAFITLFLKLLPSLFEIGSAALPIIKRSIEIWNGTTPPTEADWRMLHDFEATLTAEIQAPTTDEEFAP